MVRKTRSQPAPKPSSSETSAEAASTATKALPPSTSNPPKLFVLPKNTSKDARIVTLDNPATGAPSRYYFCPDKGFYEFTRITAPKKSCRSWLINGSPTEEAKQKEEDEDDGTGLESGYVTKDADLFVATPIDTLFLVLPALAPKSTKDTKQLFLELDDYLDILSSSSPHWKPLLSQHPALKPMIEKKVRTICDTVDAGDQTMYRLSTPKLLTLLMTKATRMVARGLPPSLEQRHIKAALEVPVMSVRREESTLSAVSTTSTPATDDTTPASESQTSTSTSTITTTTITSEETSTTIPTTTTQEPTPSSLPEITHLLRLRTSLTYLTTTYLPPSLHPLLSPSTTKNSSTNPSTPTNPLPDFTPLTHHLSHIATQKRTALSLRNISDNISRKRAITFDEDEEQLASRAEKKRRKEEEERRKKSEGRGVKALKKVDTRGMKKMSDFFAKKT